MEYVKKLRDWEEKVYAGRVYGSCIVFLHASFLQVEDMMFEMGLEEAAAAVGPDASPSLEPVSTNV